MKTRLSHHFLLLFLFSLLTVSTPYAKAVDVCAPDLIQPDKVNQVCQKVCEEASPISQFNGQWNNSSPACHWAFYGQYGVCGCNPVACQCGKDGHQTACDEALSSGGANACSSDCNCTAGRVCNNGYCSRPPYDPNKAKICRRQHDACSTLCDSAPDEQRFNCETQCGIHLNECSH